MTAESAKNVCRVIAIANQKGGVGYEKLYIMQS